MRIVTIGGYGFTEGTFLRALREAGVDTFVDTRQRRGMRGAKYSFLNSTRLQSILANAEIQYIYVKDLAPTTAVRDAQKKADLTTGTLKHERTELSDVFVDKYRSEVLGHLDLDHLKSRLASAKTVALFCVESHPSACHRSVAAEYLNKSFVIAGDVEHLEP